MLTEEDIQHYNLIINESNKKIERLKLLNTFFKSNIIFDILVKIQIIQDMFINNKELDINKLESFNIQFTNTVIDLLQHIKTVNEQQIILITKEISLYEEQLSRIQTLEVKYNLYFLRDFFKIYIKNIYNILQKNYGDLDPFTLFEKHLLDYFNKFILESKINSEFKGTDFNSNIIFYKHKYFIIEKKLLGILNKNDFNFEFVNIFKDNINSILIFNCLDIYFYYNFNLKTFNLLDKEVYDFYLKNIKDDFLNLKNKISNLEIKIKETKTKIPDTTIKILNDLYDKISNVNFLENLQKIDMQNGMLKAMLNTEIL